MAQSKLRLFCSFSTGWLNSSLISGLILLVEDAVLIHPHCGSMNVVAPCDSKTKEASV